jgi:hypothetical protein
MEVEPVAEGDEPVNEIRGLREKVATIFQEFQRDSEVVNVGKRPVSIPAIFDAAPLRPLDKPKKKKKRSVHVEKL